MKDKEILAFGKQLLEHVKNNYLGAYYKDDRQMNLIIDRRFRLHLREWSGKPYYLILYYNGKYKWEFFLQRLIFNNKKITCYLAKPRNHLNQKVYNDFFEEYHNIPDKITTLLKEQYINLHEKQGYLLCKGYSEQNFFHKYLELLDKILEAHSMVQKENYISNPNYRKGKISKKRSAPSHPLLSPIEYSDLHQKLQLKAMKYYESLGWKVEAEVSHRSDTSRIDLLATKGKEKAYIEIKPYRNSRECIREALGQLLEYWYYKKSDDYPKATKLVIAGLTKCNEPEIKFLQKLVKRHRIPIEYQQIKL